MKKISVLNTKGEKVNDITLNEEVWELHQMMPFYMMQLH